MDRYAVIWTRTATGPIKMGDLVVTERETRFSYTEEFLDSKNPSGLSLLSSPRLYGRNPVVFQTRQVFPLHPRLMQYIPGHGRGNIQRRLYTKILEKRANPPAPGFDTDWEILLLAGRNGIGHLDIFRDDRSALEWYERPPREMISNADRSTFWQSIRDDISQDILEMDAEKIAQLLGPTPSAGGMIPKLLVSIPDKKEWCGEFASAGIRELNSQSYLDVILKIEPVEYGGVVALESLCLDIHSELGFAVPRHWVAAVDGMQLLAIERFDRDQAGVPIPMESFYSVFATGDRQFNGNEDTDIEEVGVRLEKLSAAVNLDHRKARREVFRRFCVAFCTGNGDMHLDNLSFLGGPDKVRLSPVYDPAPMRAWPQHNIRSAIPIDFDGPDLAANFIRIGTAFGMSSKGAAQVLHEILDATANYTGRVMELENVPRARKQLLVDILSKERGELQRNLTAWGEFQGKE